MPQRSPPRVEIAHFDTKPFEPEHRFDAWNENMGTLFDLLKPDGGTPDGDMNARIDACHLGDAVFGVTTAQSQLFSRKDRRVVRDGMDHILVQVFLKGGGLTSSEDRINAGDILVIDLDQAHEMVNTDFANLTMVLPRDLNPNLSGLLARFHGKRLGQENPMAPFVAEHLCALWKHVPTMDMSHGKIAVNATLGLMETWLTHEAQMNGDTAPEVSLAVGKSIFRYIDRHLGEPLNPEILAQMFRISRSQLYRIFAAHDGVARYILERRLRRSLYMLTQPAHSDMNIGAIGFACGFSSESQFSKSFKSRYAIPPRETRIMSLMADGDDFSEGTDKSDETPPFAAWIKNLGRRF